MELSLEEYFIKGVKFKVLDIGFSSGEKMKEIYINKKTEFREIHSIKGNILSKLIHLTYLFGYASIYKAVLDKTDPTPVNSINFIKERL